MRLLAGVKHHAFFAVTGQKYRWPWPTSRNDVDHNGNAAMHASGVENSLEPLRHGNAGDDVATRCGRGERVELCWVLRSSGCFQCVPPFVVLVVAFIFFY